MGTASFHVGSGNRGRGNGSPTLMSSKVRVSGAFATSTTAANLEDSTNTDIELAPGDILQIHASEPMRIMPAGGTATASTGIYLPENVRTEIECAPGDEGAVSIIDVS